MFIIPLIFLLIAPPLPISLNSLLFSVSVWARYINACILLRLAFFTHIVCLTFIHVVRTYNPLIVITA